MIDQQELLENPCIRYLLNECNELRRAVRQLQTESLKYQKEMMQTAEAFNLQWESLNFGDNLATDTSFMATILDDLASHTKLSPTWFKGKRVLDLGCGSGRWSYALASAGAYVTAFDLSENGLKATAELCADFPHVKTIHGNVLRGLPFEQSSFDYVWSYGVLHHTGNTQGALEALSPLIKNGGGLFLMLYGEPRNIDEFREVNEYTKHRKATADMSLTQKMDYCKDNFPPSSVHGWFDAIAPTINDLHSFAEIKHWLKSLNFERIEQTTKNRNIHLTAWKSA